MNGEQISNTDLVAEQLVVSSGAPVEEALSVWPLVTWATLGLAVGFAVVLGIGQGHNPVDQMAQCLALMPLTILLVDAWALGMSFIRQRSVQVLLIPYVLGIVHFLLWIWCKYLVQFGIFYRPESTGPLEGVFVARWGVIALLGGITLVALLTSVFVAWRTVVLLSVEDIPIAEQAQVDKEQISEDHIFEAQALLSNLGYEVGGINGELSETTSKALKQFQVVAGLVPSGDVNMQTITILYDRGNVQSAPSVSQSIWMFVLHVLQSIIHDISDWWRRAWI